MVPFKIVNLQFPIFCILELADTSKFCSRKDIAWDLISGTESIPRIWNELKMYDLPFQHYGYWIGWARETLVGSQLWWNWGEVDSTRYTERKELFKDLSAQHIRVMITATQPKGRRNLFKEAKKLDIIVKDADGETNMVPNTAFDVGMLNLTHPDGGSWFRQILRVPNPNLILQKSTLDVTMALVTLKRIAMSKKFGCQEQVGHLRARLSLA
ncbi:hypothetical protein C1H46_037553 [Malus baccata]|uniref:Glycoside hydrolase family 31 TIM barrel domain-containing protein n=1 Tax=Malus baccata TaxID=106549 RepID=A0A540KRQ7_MALBA|nr:hypothetical protein C1H46_037553 [Malus baccata]